MKPDHGAGTDSGSGDPTRSEAGDAPEWDPPSTATAGAPFIARVRDGKTVAMRRALAADVDPAANLRHWVTAGGPEKTTAESPIPVPPGTVVAVPLGTEGQAVFGIPGRGKTSAADLTRADLVARGVPHQETATTHGGARHVEFTVHRPGPAASAPSLTDGQMYTLTGRMDQNYRGVMMDQVLTELAEQDPRTRAADTDPAGGAA